MTRAANKLAAIFIAFMSGCSYIGVSRSTSPDGAGASSLEEAIQDTMAEAREAVREHGTTKPAMERIEAALSRLARATGLKERDDLRELHDGGAASVVLASDGKDDLTLILTRFQPGRSTPIHDHGSWAVAHVVEGQERYIRWERVDAGDDPQRAVLRVDYEQTLNAGDGIYWLDPPHDIHSQQAVGGVAWELLLFGKNPQQREVHYFDLRTGRVTTRSPVRSTGGGD